VILRLHLDATGFHHDRALRDAERSIVVLGEQDADALARDARQVICEIVSGRGSESAERLVQEQEFRLGHQCARDREDGALSARQRVGGGDTDKAEDLHHEALAIQSTNGFAPNVLDSLEALGGLAIAAESYAEGIRLLAAATAGRVAIGTRRQPIEQRGFERDIEAARDGLGEQTFDIAWAEGRRSSRPR
jgi:hypothetical protein